MIETKRWPLTATLFVVALLGGNLAADEIDIPYTKAVLDNGLTVIVHEDHKAPITAVNVWYHVGSKNENPGRTGFAHLFEHLMFQGSENYDNDFISSLEKLGATDLNGTTWFDRTNYFETVPKNALDTVLWLESDRMGHFAGAISQEKLDEQRGVVQNEKRQGDNQPYGMVFEKILKQLFPGDHPYSWETIGSMEDLDAATLDDVKDWFATWYGPNNAVVVIAGDVDTADALQRAERFFGDIPPGPPLGRPDNWIPRHDHDRRLVMEDRVPQARLYKSWTGPEWGSKDSHYLSLAAMILGGDKNSRLYKRLVYDDQIATDVELAPITFEIAGVTYLVVSVQEGHTLAELEAAADEEIARFIKEGPTRKELERVKTSARAGFLRGIERVGGVSGKSGVLAKNMVYGGSPDLYKQELATIAAASRNDLRDAAAEWLGQGAFVLEVMPYGPLSASGEGADRSAVPEPGPPPAVDFPRFDKTTLDNGLPVILARRPGNPLAYASIIFDAGFASDQFSRPGTAKFAMAMLDEGTSSRSALEISETLAAQGAHIDAGSDLDSSFVSLSALRENFDASLDIFADVVLEPSFPKDELGRARRIALNELQQEKNRPTSMGLRVLPSLMYGPDHPYGQPLTGSGTAASIEATSRDDLVGFHETWMSAGNATLIVVADISMSELKPKLERLFGDWKVRETPVKPISDGNRRAGNTVYVLDRPDSQQSVIFAGQLLPPKANPDEIAIQAMNDILGGTFSARINMNLREDKHWSYGAYSFIRDARGPRPLIAYAQVQTDKTRESLIELKKEIDEINAARPPTPGELNIVKNGEILGLAGRWESSASVLGAISELVEFNLPDDYWSTYAGRIRNLELSAVTAAAREIINPAAITWVVVGDRAVIEKELRQLNFDNIEYIDTDGSLIEP